MYITQDGDRWDLIAWKVYGNSKLYNVLLEANAIYRRTVIFSAGVKLIIPEIENLEEVKEVSPPWQTD